VFCIELEEGRLLFVRRGYLLLLVGVLIGFLAFSAISSIYSGSRPQHDGGEMPSEIEFEFLLTSEKQGWIEEVTPRFEKWFSRKFNVSITVRLITTGTHDTVNRILDGSERPTVWSPASSIWIPYMNDMWRDITGWDYDVAVDWTPLVLSPVVLTGWGFFMEEHEVTGFMDLYHLAEDGVDFKYGHPDPLLSNGGTMTVVLEFAEAAGKKPEELTVEDLMNETVIDVKKWDDPLIAIYPERGTLIADHPFVILNGTWVNSWQRFAAGQYLFFLLKPENQELAQKHGFRPASSSVPLDQTLFNPSNGVQYEIRVPVLKPLKGEVMKAIFTAWVRVRNTGI